MKKRTIFDFKTSITVVIVIGSIMGGVLWQWTPMTAPPTSGWWQTSIPAEQGMDSTKLDQMMEFVENQGFAIDSILIVRHGYLVLEEYPRFYSKDSRHELYSVTKSFTSALIGIAIQEGFIESVEQKVVDFFPDRTIANLDARKQNMTIEHLLTMTAGYEWLEGDGGRLRTSLDSVQYILDKPMVSTPGTVFNYGDGTSHLLSAIISQTSGYSAMEFAQKFLFNPLGISNVEWRRDLQGVNLGGSGLSLTPRDMAKFGCLILNNGTWDGEQIVPAEWVARSTETSFVPWEGISYGFQWWAFPQSGVYFASGLYGQKIFIVPEHDMVVVFTADIREGPRPEDGLLHHFISSTSGCEKYSKYGFSFDYPSGMVIREGGVIEESISEVSGEIQATIPFYPYETIGVIWDTVESIPEPEAALNELFTVLEGYGTEVNDRGLRETSIKGDHELVYQHFNITEQGLPQTGVIGSWYCDNTSRLYIFYYVTLPQLITQQDVFTGFWQHLESFVCTD